MTTTAASAVVVNVACALSSFGVVEGIAGAAAGVLILV
jgi:hypothetical protein